jgi:hypothetical protein
MNFTPEVLSGILLLEIVMTDLEEDAPVET